MTISLLLSVTLFCQWYDFIIGPFVPLLIMGSYPSPFSHFLSPLITEPPAEVRENVFLYIKTNHIL